MTETKKSEKSDSRRVVLTAERIGKLVLPATGRIYVHDAKLLGLCVCVTATGSRTFYLYRKVAGRPQRIKLGKFPDELGIDAARKMAGRMNNAIAEGRDPQAEKLADRGEWTLAKTWEHFEENHVKAKNRPATVAGYKWLYDKHLSKFHNRRLSEVKRPDVLAWHTKLGTENGKYVANRAAGLLRQLFAYAANALEIDVANPARKLPKFKEQSRERFLAADEMPRFLNAVECYPDPTLRDFFLMLLFTGARRGAVMSMQWADVHIERREWTIPHAKSKSGSPVTVALTPEAVAILTRRMLESNGSPFVFASHGKSGHIVEAKAAWKTILDKAGISNLRIHDLRRTLGSWQAAAGTSLTIIGKSLGHSTPQSTAIYARLNLDPVRQSVESAVAAMMNAGKGGANGRA